MRILKSAGALAPVSVVFLAPSFYLPSVIAQTPSPGGQISGNGTLRIPAGGGTPAATGSKVMPLVISIDDLNQGESIWVGTITKAGKREFTVNVRLQSGLGIVRMGPLERSFKWDDTVRMRAMEDPAAAVDTGMLRVGAGVNVIAAQGEARAPMQARLIVVRLNDLPAPAPVAPPLGADVKPEFVVRGTPQSSRAAAFSPDGATLALAIADGYRGSGPVHLWDTGKMLPRIGLNSQDGGNQILQFSPDGKFLAGVTDQTVQHDAGILWNGVTGARIAAMTNIGASSMAWSPDSKMLACLLRDSLTIVLMRDGYLASDGPLAAANEAGRAPAPRTFHVNIGQQTQAMGWDAEGCLWTASLDFRNPEPIARWRISPGDDPNKPRVEQIAGYMLPGRVAPLNEVEADKASVVKVLAFSPDATMLAGIIMDANTRPIQSEFRVWETTTGKFFGGISGVTWESNLATFAPQNDAVAIGSDDGTVRVFDLKANKQKYNLQAHKGRIRALAWSPDGKTLVTTAVAATSADCDVRFWDAATGALRLSLYPLAQLKNVGYFPPKPTLPPPDWFAATPEGTVDASPGAGFWLRWRVGETMWPWDAYADALCRPGISSLAMGAAKRP